jgi:hypothetical protein
MFTVSVAIFLGVDLTKDLREFYRENGVGEGDPIEYL